MNRENAFTLIELLVVVAIIGIISAIALAGFSQYRARGHDASASQDLRTMATSQEAQYVDTATYVSCTDRLDCIDKLPGISTLDDNTVMSVTANAGESFEGLAASSFGSGRSFRWNNTSGLEIIN